MNFRIPLCDCSISVLTNSHLYFLHYVVIIRLTKGFRVVVVKQNKRVFDKEFKNVRGARISFSRSFQKYTTPANRKLKNEWTPFYQPEMRFLYPILTYPLSDRKENTDGRD